jgi:predicted nucleic acid-binding Zn ribbon protein
MFLIYMLSILFIKNSSSRLCLVKCYVKLVCFRCFSTKHWEDQTRTGQRVIYSYVQRDVVFSRFKLKRTRKLETIFIPISTCSQECQTVIIVKLYRRVLITHVIMYKVDLIIIISLKINFFLSSATLTHSIA